MVAGLLWRAHGGRWMVGACALLRANAMGRSAGALYTPLMKLTVRLTLLCLSPHTNVSGTYVERCVCRRSARHMGLPERTKVRQYGTRGVAGIEPTTSRTLSENHTTRPNSLALFLHSYTHIIGRTAYDRGGRGSGGRWASGGVGGRGAPPPAGPGKLPRSAIIAYTHTRGRTAYDRGGRGVRAAGASGGVGGQGAPPSGRPRETPSPCHHSVHSHTRPYSVRQGWAGGSGGRWASGGVGGQGAPPPAGPWACGGQASRHRGHSGGAVNNGTGRLGHRA